MANMSRRSWIRSSAFLAGSMTFISGTFKNLVAAPIFQLFSESETEAAIARSAPPVLKARLFANENPFGPSHKAKKAIVDAMDLSYQYPFMFAEELPEKIAAFEGLKPENILLAAGSTSLLLAAAIYYSKNGGNIVTGNPSYSDLPQHAEQFGAKIIQVPLTAEYKLDLEAMEKSIDSNTKLVYICNPNNPTGTVLDTARLKAFCERVSKKTLVFVDEAYIDYLPDTQAITMMGAVKNLQNVIVARTFSKLYGFAGLRIGYIAAQPETIKQMELYSSGPNPVCATSLRAALAAYQDREFLDGALAKTNASKKYLYDVLKKEGYEYIPSSTNFVMFPIKMDGAKFADEMMKRGVGIRFWKFNNKDWCRVSIGRMDEMQAFAEAFKEIS